MKNDIKVLLFTVSRNRPIFLRHCLFQMQSQSYSHSHVVYVNSDEFVDEHDSTNILHCMRDVKIRNGNDLLMGYGPSSHQHHNHMAAINMVDSADFDLFLKVDDDDIYYPDYVQSVVDDFLQNAWDVSGSFSDGLINKGSFDYSKCYEIDYTLSDGAIFSILPGTLAFSRQAMTLLLTDFSQQLDFKLFEDEQWISYLSAKDDIIFHKRERSYYVYNIHQSNISKPKKRDEKS